MIKLSVPYIGNDEIEAISQVINSKYIVQGIKVESFEKLIQNYLGVKNAIAVSSGTAALHLALLALDIHYGDEVIVPDYTFPATVNAVEVVGGNSKLIDIDLNSFCIDINKIEGKITEKTKLIIPVHEFGHPANMEVIMEIANKYNIKVVEDAACALGAKFKGEMVGTIGDIGCFSLHPRKAITTGEGGILVTNNDELAEKIKSLRNHGIKTINGKNEFVLPGLNYRMTDIQGAMAIIQIQKIDEINKRRKEVALWYDEGFKNMNKVIIPRETADCTHIWQTYHILLQKELDRDKVIKKLKEVGVETNIGAYSIHNQIYYKEKYHYNSSEFFSSEYAYNYGLALPLYVGITEEQVKEVIEKVGMIIYGQ